MQFWILYCMVRNGWVSGSRKFGKLLTFEFSQEWWCFMICSLMNLCQFFIIVDAQEKNTKTPNQTNRKKTMLLKWCTVNLFWKHVICCWLLKLLGLVGLWMIHPKVKVKSQRAPWETSKRLDSFWKTSRLDFSGKVSWFLEEEAS